MPGSMLLAICYQQDLLLLICQIMHSSRSHDCQLALDDRHALRWKYKNKVNIFSSSEMHQGSKLLEMPLISQAQSGWWKGWLMFFILQGGVLGVRIISHSKHSNDELEAVISCNDSVFIQKLNTNNAYFTRMHTSLEPLERGYTILLKNCQLGIESQSTPF